VSAPRLPGALGAAERPLLLPVPQRHLRSQRQGDGWAAVRGGAVAAALPAEGRGRPALHRGTAGAARRRRRVPRRAARWAAGSRARSLSLPPRRGEGRR
jgi:hypothetical protein